MGKRLTKEALLVTMAVLSVCIYIAASFLSPFDPFNGGNIIAVSLLGAIALSSLIGVIIGTLLIKGNFKVSITVKHAINIILFIVCGIMFIRSTIGVIVLLTLF